MMPVNTSADALDGTGKYLVVLSVIALVLSLNGVALGYLLGYCAVVQLGLWFTGYFREDWKSPLDIAVDKLQTRLTAKLSRETVS